MKKIKLLLMGLLALTWHSASLAEFCPADVANLQPGHWCSVPGSDLDQLDPCPDNECTYSGDAGFKHLMNGWSGGAYDTINNRLLINGGGHKGYIGNDTYAFDVDTLQWTQINPPAEVLPSDGETVCHPSPGYDLEQTGLNEDGSPRSRHTRSNIAYSPINNSLYLLGAAGTSPCGQTGDNFVHYINVTGAPVWSRADDITFVGKNRGAAATDADGNIWVHKNAKGGFGKLDVATGQWTAYASQGGMQLEGSAAIDTTRNNFLVMASRYGDHDAYVWDLDASTSTPPTDVRSSMSAFHDQRPGLTYDSATDQYVLWKGGSNVYTIDPETFQDAAVSAAPTNTVTPTAPNPQGTYGRFRYVPTKNVFILVNATNENVYFYKLSAGAGSPAPSINFSANPTTIDEGQSSTLTWTVSNADTCTATGGWSGNKNAAGGTQSTGALNATTTFTLSCTGAGGTRSDAATVTVNDPNPPPTVTLSADDNSITQGDDVVLTYTISDADSCNASSNPANPDFSGSITPQDGSQTVTNLQNDITFTLFCSNANGNTTRTAAVTVSEPLSYALYNDDDGTFGSGEVLLSNAGDLSGQIYVHVLPETDIVSVRYSVDGSNVGSTEGAAPYVLDGDDGYDSNLMIDGSHTITALVQTSSDTLTLTENVIINNSGGTIDPPPTLSVALSPTSIEEGQSATLSWDSTNATSCEGLSGITGPLASVDGNQTVSPNSTTIYEIRCTGNGGMVTDSATLTVTPPPNTDNDNDGVSNDDEAINGTDPNDPDTDNDGLDDGEEITYNTDPLDPDSDNDGSTDGAEVTAGSDPNDGNDTPNTVPPTTDEEDGGGVVGLWMWSLLTNLCWLKRRTVLATY
ncbi:MAG: hypothetical protein HKM24_01945 [Gammaproteobacteria bacterium]|nr:hypothetical protein [Gammaproteobacteria bacterium]